MSAATNESLRNARTSAWQLRKRVKLIVKSKRPPNCIQSLLSLLVQFTAFQPRCKVVINGTSSTWMALRASDSQRADERQWGGKRQSTQKERNNKDTRERLWLMEKLLQETDGWMQTARRSFQQLTASVCTSVWKGSTEPWAGGLVQSLQPAKDTIVTVIIQLQSRTISWVRSWREIWAEAAHFIRNVDSFWLFFLLLDGTAEGCSVLKWLCLHRNGSRKWNIFCLRGCYHSVLRANCNTERRAASSRLFSVENARNS